MPQTAKTPEPAGQPLRDLVRDPPSRNFALPKWIDEEKIVRIIDALNNGGCDSDSSSDQESEEE
jgi:hypothetical protein